MYEQRLSFPIRFLFYCLFTQLPPQLCVSCRVLSYGNSCVHRLSADGKHLQTWGESGSDAGQFNIPHNVAMTPSADGILVADRENSRVQIFGLDGA